MKATETETLWAKVGEIKEICLIAKTIIMYGRDCILQFHNLSTGEHSHLTLNAHKKNGDGLKCFKGHPTLNIFAYAENCHEAHIYVKTYPDFQLINKLPGGIEGYKNLEFSDGSLLFALSELPTYKLTAWNWKAAEKMVESPGKFICANQQLRCSFGRPMFLAQLGIGTNRLYIWDVFTVCKYTIFADHEVKLGTLKPAPFQYIAWSPESVMLYIIDSAGCIYTVDRDFYLELVIDNTQTEIIPTVTPSICWYHHGLTVSGPSREIRHYKKVGSAWMCDSQFATQEIVLGVTSTKTDKCIGFTLDSEIVSFAGTPESLSYVKKGESNFSHVCLVNPLGRFLIVTRGLRDIDVCRVETGDIVSSLTLEGKIASIAENPMYPFVALGLENGCIQLISFYNELKPVILTRFYLTENPLSTTRFYEQGYIFVTGNRDLGEFFILKGLPGTQVEVVINIQIGRQVVDYMLVASQNIMRFFAIPVTQDEYYAGNQIWRWCIVDKSVVNLKVFTFESPNAALYRRIYARKGVERDRTFYLIPFLTRHLVAAETKRGDPLVYITDTIKTGHQTKMFLMNFTARHVISWGYEGFVFVRSLDFSQIEGLALCNHRYHQGVRRALANPSSTIIVTLGFSGVLAAVKMNNKSVDEQIEAEVHRLYNTPKVELMFKRPTLGYIVEDRFTGKCWKEIERLKTIEEEERQCAVERNSILEEFWDIQKSVQQLVDANFSAPDNKKLDLLEFYLDTQSYQKKQQQNKEDCKQLETYLKCLIVAQDKVSQYIIKNYYETMGVQWRIIKGIFSVIQATNYCFLPEDQALLKRLEWIDAHRRVERYLTSEDTFEPWHSMTPEELEELKNKRPVIPKDDYGALANLLKAKEETDAVDPEKFMETKIALLGTASQLFIDANPARYYQGQLNTFFQCALQQQVVQYELIKLKQCYNKCFTNTRSLKEREMYSIKERNARLRHIISEFNFFSENKININIQDPEWQPVENVETDILRVSDNEVPVTPYVSPSEQAILDAKAAEEERIRLLLLADDFRERALMTMMNGVLEVRWEDELKKDVPKPKCLLEKDPSEYNEEDLKAIKDYEEKVAQLKTEREKYKSLLEAEFVKMSVSLRDAIRKFNWKLYECTRFKYHIDSSMNQENMIVNRQRVVQQARIEIDEKEKTILKTIKNYEVEMEMNQKSILQIQEALSECRNNMDSIQLKEKQLEKLYRKDFQDMSPVVQEQSFKLYKKRPKASLKNINTISGLNELAKGIMTNETNFSMTQECLEYIKAVDVLDAFVGLPPTIDETVWHMICKHRRSRIEYEIRLRTVQLQVLEGEATVATFHKRVATQKEKIAALSAQLEETREQRLRLLHNKQIQLVLRRGLVEIPLNGDMINDFTDAILVPKAEIEHVNSLIVEAGQLKLKTIEQNMKFRRTMMVTEWEHMRLRMKINDFIEQKRDIENVKFTKEMQSYLKNKSLGRKPAVESYELEIELLAAAYENRIKGKEDKVKKIEAQLKSFKESNKQLDKTIKEVNIDLCYYHIEKDFDVEEKEKEIIQARMKGMLHRNQLVQKIQKNHNEILVLQAELELLRLRTFPTFKYKVYDNPE